MKTKTWTLGLAGAALLATAALTAPPEALAAEMGAEEIMKQAHMNLYYAGDDGKSVVEMTLEDKRGKQRTRKFVMFRLDLTDGGAQKYYTYFLEPSDVRRTSFMVWKDPDADDSRWIYVPAIDLVRRISANDKGSSFVGSDFSYEDVSGRHWTDDTHVLVGEETLNGVATYVIESTPKEKDEFAKKKTWVDKEKMLPIREEYVNDKGELIKLFEALEMEEVDGILTITKRRMTNPKKEHQTTVAFSEVAYDIGVEEDIFTERYLKSPPSNLISN